LWIEFKKSQFFLRWSRSYDSNCKLNRLTRFTRVLFVLLFLIFFKKFHLSTLDWLKIKLHNLFRFVLMRLSSYYESGHEFNILTQVDSSFFFCILFLIDCLVLISYFNIKFIRDCASWFLFNLLFTRLSQFHDLDHGFDELTWLTLIIFFFPNWPFIFSISFINIGLIRN
jgi:uncharacterized membrane protein AbrB (regulator of aidB expression)